MTNKCFYKGFDEGDNDEINFVLSFGFIQCEKKSLIKKIKPILATTLKLDSFTAFFRKKILIYFWIIDYQENLSHRNH